MERAGPAATIEFVRRRARAEVIREAEGVLRVAEDVGVDDSIVRSEVTAWLQELSVYVIAAQLRTSDRDSMDTDLLRMLQDEWSSLAAAIVPL
jgi:hypothetical protein